MIKEFRAKATANKMRRSLMPTAVPAEGLIRLPQVLSIFPVSRSTWWAGVKTGRFPEPVRLGPRTVAWRVCDIRTLIAETEAESGIAK